MQLQPENWVPDWPQTEHLAQIADERGVSLAPVPQLARLQLQAALVVKTAGISTPYRTLNYAARSNGRRLRILANPAPATISQAYASAAPP